MPRKGTKAKDMLVSMSDVAGMHSIRLGVAYWYRGHYLYGPQGNPIEPVPFATKEIHIVGTTADTAPVYDPHSSLLGDEREIAALYKSMVNEWNDMQVQEKAVEPSEDTTGGHTTTGEDKPSETAKTDIQGYAQPEYEGLYNAQAMYLAASAPVSNHATPMHANTPSHSRPVSPSHVHSSIGAMAHASRPLTSMSRVDQLMIGHGISRSIATLQHTAPWLLNAEAVAASVAASISASSSSRDSRHSARPGLSRIPSMFEGDDNITLGGKHVARPAPSHAGFIFPHSQPTSRAHSRVPSAITGFNESSGFSSRPVSRDSSLALHMAEPMFRQHSRMESLTTGGAVRASRPTSYLRHEAPGESTSFAPTSTIDSSSSSSYHDAEENPIAEPGARRMSRPVSLPINMAEALLEMTESISDSPRSVEKTQNQVGKTPERGEASARHAPPVPSPTAYMRNTSSPSFGLPSRVPSTTNVDDVFATPSSSTLPRAKSSLCLLGDDLNSHSSRFFPTKITAAQVASPPDVLTMAAVGKSRPRKDSMAKASKALNQAFVKASRKTPTPVGSIAARDTTDTDTNIDGPSNAADTESNIADPSDATVYTDLRDNIRSALDRNIGGSDCAITTSSSFSEPGHLLVRCVIHGGDCDGVTVTHLHATELARSTTGLIGELPMVQTLGREMVDWYTVLFEERENLNT